MISSYRGLTAYTRTRSFALRAAARNRPPYCIRGVAPTIAMERGLSIMWIDAIWLSVHNSMPPPETKWLLFAINETWFVGRRAHEPPRGTARRPFDQPALHATHSGHRISRVGRDLNQIAIRILAIDRRHGAKRTRPRGRPSDDGNAGGLEPGDDGLQTSLRHEAQIERAGRIDLAGPPAGIPGLAEIELVLAELERDALAQCGGARIGLPPEAERALVP